MTNAWLYIFGKMTFLCHNCFSFIFFISCEINGPSDLGSSYKQWFYSFDQVKKHATQARKTQKEWAKKYFPLKVAIFAYPIELHGWTWRAYIWVRTKPNKVAILLGSNLRCMFPMPLESRGIILYAYYSDLSLKNLKNNILMWTVIRESLFFDDMTCHHGRNDVW